MHKVHFRGIVYQLDRPKPEIALAFGTTTRTVERWLDGTRPITGPAATLAELFRRDHKIYWEALKMADAYLSPDAAPTA